METITTLIPVFIVMLALLGCSAFFSASEAALFFLTASERRQMSSGSKVEKAAIHLLRDPDRLLSGVLFANLLVNVAYFSLASICSLRMERTAELGSSWAVGFAMISLFILILFGEMFPKSVAVIIPQPISRLAAFPIGLLVSGVAPMIPILRKINSFSTRILWPGFKPEPEFEIQDLEQVINVTGNDEALIRQEHAVLQNIVHISTIPVEEWMRPRAQFQVFKPPVRFSDLDQVEAVGGYLLISEPKSGEIEKAIRMQSEFELPETNIEALAKPVLYLPWCANVATALERMAQRDRDVTVVVNEYGETIGILTVEDILETLFTYSPTRAERLLDQQPIVEIEPGKWLVLGITNLRILCRRLDLTLPESSSITVGGLIQEQLQRLAEVGDRCRWGVCEFHVVERSRRGALVTEVTLSGNSDESEEA